MDVRTIRHNGICLIALVSVYLRMWIKNLLKLRWTNIIGCVSVAWSCDVD